MITEEKVRLLIEERTEGSSTFLVDLSVKPGNAIEVVVDDDEGFSINDCIELNRYLEDKLDRDVEDFNLKVSSPGLDQPFKVTRQYFKNIGREVKVRKKEGGTIQGLLSEVDESGITIQTKTKERIEGRKAKQWVTNDNELAFADIDETKVVISFK